MGRRKNYEEANVLQNAMVTFWEKGYKNTSVRNLEESMGINQFSIYSSFKNKKNLFKLALLHYETYISDRFLTNLKADDSNIEDIEAFLNNFASQIISGEIPNSCMMVNTASELSPQEDDIYQNVILFFDKMQVIFKKALKNSIQNGLIPSRPDLEQSAEYLVGIAQSISIYAKVKTQKQVEEYIEFALQPLKI